VPETVARLRHLRTSPTKVRQVLALIRGKDVFLARDTLRFCDRGAAVEVGKLLDAAIANAEHNDNVPEDELFVVRAYADEGPTMKRWRPRARGRGTRIRKRTSHVTIVVARFDEAELERRRRQDAAGTGPSRGRPSRRRRPVREAHDHDDHDGHDHDGHDHDDHDHDHDDDVTTEPAAEGAPAKRATKKAPAKKAAAKKATEKAPAKRSSAGKTTAEKKTTRKSTKQGEDD
jgi:large subunit ribosomal protein L22